MKTISRVTLAAILAGGISSEAPTAEPDAASLPRQAREVLKAHCYRCHGQDGTNEGGFNYVLDARRMVERKKIVPPDAGKSKLFRRLTADDDPMPPADEKARPSADEVALLRKWIQGGAPDPDAETTAARREVFSPEAVLRAVHDDLTRSVAERDRRFTRYFTLAHLHNAGLSEEELQSYRHGLSKLVNSLSWGGRIVVPKPVDEARTVFRIDLRDYRWSGQVWDAVLAVNPYGVGLDGERAKACAELTGCRLLYVRGDWFVATASRPPLYHDILQLPRTEPELQKMLRLDVAENVRAERVARAGFNGSGVSRNNRLIERHESGSVVYWRSYDFAGNTGRQNLFASPLGFRHDGGEIIFNLPNGLQAYFLTDGEGRRIDKGPVAVVSDPKRPDRAVENGLSCMSCHARGLIDKADQVREHVLKNPAAFSKEDAETVLALHPPREKFAELVRADARRFQDAVAGTGAPLSATEPVAALALRFEAELDLSLAAAEAGVAPAKFLAALEQSPDLAQQLGPLRVEGGTVQRQVFVDAFGDLVRELRVGEYLEPRRKAYARLLARGERLLREGDAEASLRAYAEAIALEPETATGYVARGDARRHLGDNERAIADYTAALRLDPRDPVAANNRGLAHARAGDLDRAIADYTEALRLDPELAVAFHNRGAARHGKGDLERAIADHTEALRLDPKSALAHNNRGLAHLARDEYDRAVADFDRALDLDPRFATAFNNRGLARARKGDHARAIDDYTEAIRLDPKFARAYFNRAVAHEKKGDRARADQDRKKAVELDPSLGKD